MPTPPAGPENITPDLQPLAVPIEWIAQLEGNPRRGKVDQIAKSYKRFGQRKPIVVNRTGEVDGHPVGYTESGNHQLMAARDVLGWTHIAAVWETDDEATAKAFSLADNQLHSLGEYDTPLLAEFIADVAIMDDGVSLLIDAGFTGDELTAYITAAQAAAAALPADDLRPLDDDYADDDNGMIPAPGIGLGTPVISTTIVFDDGEQQTEWYRFMRHLRGEHPEMETNGERLAHYITTYIPEAS